MMEKAKLTKEQADVIGNMVTCGEVVDRHINNHWATGTRLCLNDLTTDEFIRALYVGYEVIEEIEVGDWVYHYRLKRAEEVIRINEFEPGRIETKSLIGNESMFRLATEKEIESVISARMWSEINRDIGELKIGDVIMTSSGTLYLITYTFEEMRFGRVDLPAARKWLESGSIECVYTAESCTSLDIEDYK